MKRTWGGEGVIQQHWGTGALRFRLLCSALVVTSLLVTHYSRAISGSHQKAPLLGVEGVTLGGG